MDKLVDFYTDLLLTALNNTRTGYTKYTKNLILIVELPPPGVDPGPEAP